MDWNLPEEVRESMVASRALSELASTNGSRHDTFFPTVMRRLRAEYPLLTERDLPPSLVVRHLSYGFDSPGDDWIALNPVVGRRLGWKPAVDGLFRWLNEQGEMMVETVWWVDGIVEQGPLQSAMRLGRVGS